jgi:hypothetical protein
MLPPVLTPGRDYWAVSHPRHHFEPSVPVARERFTFIELGNTAADGLDRYARIQQSDTLVIVPDDAAQHLATLLQLAGTPS